MRFKSPVRFIVAIVTVLIIIWMCYNFVIALQTGKTISFFGNGMRSGEPPFIATGEKIVVGTEEANYEERAK